MKLLKIAVSLALVMSLSMAVAPQPTHAFTLFGIRFFEPKPTPTPTPKPTATPTPAATPLPTTDEGQVLGEHENLPSTGPEQNVAVILGVITAALVARKYISHR